MERSVGVVQRLLGRLIHGARSCSTRCLVTQSEKREGLKGLRHYAGFDGAGGGKATVYLTNDIHLGKPPLQRSVGSNSSRHTISMNSLPLEHRLSSTALLFPTSSRNLVHFNSLRSFSSKTASPSSQEASVSELDREQLSPSFTKEAGASLDQDTPQTSSADVSNEGKGERLSNGDSSSVKDGIHNQSISKVDHSVGAQSETPSTSAALGKASFEMSEQSTTPQSESFGTTKVEVDVEPVRKSNSTNGRDQNAGAQKEPASMSAAFSEASFETSERSTTPQLDSFGTTKVEVEGEPLSSSDMSILIGGERSKSESSSGRVQGVEAESETAPLSAPLSRDLSEALEQSVSHTTPASESFGSTKVVPPSEQEGHSFAPAKEQPKAKRSNQSVSEITPLNEASPNASEQSISHTTPSESFGTTQVVPPFESGTAEEHSNSALAKKQPKARKSRQSASENIASGEASPDASEQSSNHTPSESFGSTMVIPPLETCATEEPSNPAPPKKGRKVAKSRQSASEIMSNSRKSRARNTLEEHKADRMEHVDQTSTVDSKNGDVKGVDQTGTGKSRSTWPTPVQHWFAPVNYLTTRYKNLEITQPKKAIYAPRLDRRPEGFDYTGVEVVFFGTSSNIPSLWRNMACVAVRIDQSTFVIDCGDGSLQQLLRSAPFRMGSINKIFITHMHGDHVHGLAALLIFLGQRNRGAQNESGRDVEFAPIQVYGPLGLRHFLRVLLSATHSGVGIGYAVHELLPQNVREQRSRRIDEFLLPHPDELPGRDIPCESDGCWHVYEDPTVVVKAGQMKHSIPCYGYTIAEKLKPGRFNKERAEELGINPQDFGTLQRGEPLRLRSGATVRPEELMGAPRRGRKIAVLGDTYDASSLYKVACDCDLLVHEATVLQEETEKNARNMAHSTASMAGKAAWAMQARTLVLTHISPKYQKQVVAGVEAARAGFKSERVLVAEDLTRIQVGFQEEPANEQHLAAILRPEDRKLPLQEQLKRALRVKARGG